MLGLSLLIALLSFLQFDPAAPQTPWTRVTDPDPFSTPEGRRSVEEIYRFESADPWGVHEPAVREKYRQRLEAMLDAWGQGW